MADINVLYSDFKNFVQSIDPFASASSTFAENILALKETAKNEALSTVQKYEAYADSFYAKYQEYADTASKYAARAESAGESALADLANKTAQTFQQAAAERQAIGDAEWVKKLSAESVLALRELDSAWKALGEQLKGSASIYFL